MMMLKTILPIIFLAMGCVKPKKADEGNNGHDSGKGETFEFTSQQQVQSQLLDTYCVSCHGSAAPAAGIGLTDWNLLLTGNGQDHGQHEHQGHGAAPLIAPGEPKKSSLYLVIESGKMPPGDEKVPAEKVSALFRFIAALTGSAPGDGEGGDGEPDAGETSGDSQDAGEDGHGDHGDNHDGAGGEDGAGEGEESDAGDGADDHTDHTDGDDGHGEGQGEAGDEGGNEGGEGEGEDDSDELLPTTESVQKWSNRNCHSCHKQGTHENRHTDVTDIKTLIATSWEDPTVGHYRKIIIPGLPTKSLFLTSMDPDYTPAARLMPKELPAIPRDELAIITQWIAGLPMLTPKPVNHPDCAFDLWERGCPCYIDQTQEICDDDILFP